MAIRTLFPGEKIMEIGELYYSFFEKLTDNSDGQLRVSTLDNIDSIYGDFRHNRS
jgi:hypothetical protein